MAMRRGGDVNMKEGSQRCNLSPTHVPKHSDKQAGKTQR